MVAGEEHGLEAELLEPGHGLVCIGPHRVAETDGLPILASVPAAQLHGAGARAHQLPAHPVHHAADAHAGFLVHLLGLGQGDAAGRGLVGDGPGNGVGAVALQSCGNAQHRVVSLGDGDAAGGDRSRLVERGQVRFAQPEKGIP